LWYTCYPIIVAEDSVLKTILITGGANGLGKGLALHYLAKGDRVITVGSSAANGESLYDEAKQLGAEERMVFLQADLSLVKENMRIIGALRNDHPAIDALVFCATRHCKEYTETAEGLEFSFALDYLSRFILSYELKECLEKTGRPVIMNVCGTGMKGYLNWSDMQHKKSFNPMKVMMHGSRLNDLSGVAFAYYDIIGKINYVLYNPMAVQTPGMTGFGGSMMRLYYKLAARPIEKAVIPIAELMENPPAKRISSFKERKKVSLELPAFDKDNALKLYEITRQIIRKIEAVE